jgi:hypothetical protein
MPGRPLGRKSWGQQYLDLFALACLGKVIQSTISVHGILETETCKPVNDLPAKASFEVT